MQATVDLSALLEQEEFNNETYQTLREQAFYSSNTLERFLQLLQSYERKVVSGERQGKTDALRLGLCHLALGRHERAREWLQKAPAGADRSFYLGRTLMDLRQYDAAIAQFDQAAGQGRNRLVCDCLKAECLLLKGDEAAAESLLRTHAAGGEEQPDWLYTWGRLAEQRGDLDEAIEHYEAATDKEEDHVQAVFHLAYLLDLHGADERAKSLYQTCSLLPYVHVDALINLAINYEDAGDYDKAAQCLYRVVAVDPTHPRANLYLKDVNAARNMFIDETQVKEQELQGKVLDIPVTDFELSVRSRNCLKKMNINTLGDLLRITEAELLAYKNFGETSLKEIKAMLLQKGLELGQNARPDAVTEFVDQEPLVDPLGDSTLMSRSVSTLELSVRARKCLQRLDINTIGELTSRSEAELLEARNFGHTSLSEIRERLQQIGLDLRAS